MALMLIHGFDRVISKTTLGILNVNPCPDGFLSISYKIKSNNLSNTSKAQKKMKDHQIPIAYLSLNQKPLKMYKTKLDTQINSTES
jgi:hypothetical protein